MSERKDSLADAEHRISNQLGPRDRALRLFPRLKETANDLRTRLEKSPAGRELLDMAAEQIEQAAELLRVLEQE
jgi:DNA-binding transcriptional regulator GbsR (MarR family)